MNKVIPTSIFFLLLLFTVSDAKMISRTKVEMGTFITISLEEKNKNFIEEGFKILHKINLALSSYDKDGLIYKLNNQKEVDINHYTYEAFLFSKKYYTQTNGYFDITIGSITKDLYRFGLDEKVPTKEELQNAKVEFKSLSFTKNKATLKQGIKVDLGGMGKGFGVDKIALFYKKQNIQKGIISASGDIRCLGICSVDIQDPYSDGILGSFITKQKNLSITTSGNYNRYIDSLNHNHLINPKDKESQTKFISITLISNLNNSDIDAYATAASVMPIKKAYLFLDSLELGYVVLQSDGELIVSDNIDDYTKDLFINYTKK